jgi:NADPH-dependent glutamate synthase beta subunit-like oxidoreductase/NAD-dependent dihydropyrimidine dehydrogenase PreA subunit
MAAYELTAKGHGVTVFEAASEPGGMLRWAIPDFRLPLSEVQYSIRMLEKMGVDFKTGLALGKELNPEKLEREWDALLFATGGGSPANLGVPGVNLPGVYQGMDLLRKAREGKTVSIGKSVTVIGGGNTAIDSALLCRKMGAEDVSIVCLEERSRMPAFQGEIEEAVEEGIKIFDGWGPRRILKNGGKELTLELSRCIRVIDDQGRFCPELEKTGAWLASAESVVVAIGQRRDLAHFPTEFREERNKGLADPLTLQTTRPKIFMAGDVVTGPRSVIEAMAQGREAAVSIDRFLCGETLRWGRAFWEGAYTTDFSSDKKNVVARPRAVLPRLPIPERKLHLEIEKTMDQQTARDESERCLGCGQPAEVNQTCWYCLPCEIECPVDALEVRMPYLVR